MIIALKQTASFRRSRPGISGTAMGLWVYILALVLFTRLYRRMEVRADAAARACEAAPGTYARALERIHEANRVPIVIASRKHKYPELYDRLVEAGAPPDYPRPVPPPRGPLYAGLLILVLAATAECLALIWLGRAVTGIKPAVFSELTSSI